MSIPLETGEATARPATRHPEFLYVGVVLINSFSFGSPWFEDPRHPERLPWIPVLWILSTIGACLVLASIVFEISRRRAATKWDAEHRPLGYFPVRRPSPKLRRLKVVQRTLVAGGLVLMVAGASISALGFANANVAALASLFAGLAVLLASLVVTLVYLSADAQQRYAEARR